jgi:CzcA family heavy metal efflux pump
MMRDFFVTHKNPVAVIIAVIILAGLFTYTRMQSSLFPEVTFPKIKVIAENGLQPVNKMMITVTKPLEEAIKRVPDLKIVKSITSRGSCEISAFMDWNADIDLSKQQIESAIAQISNELPRETSISIEKMNPSILPVIGYVIDGPGRSPIEISQIANYVVKPYLSQVDGVSEIGTIGGKIKEYHIELNRQKMSALGISPSAIAEAFSKTNFITSNGYLTDFNRLYLTITDASVDNAEELQNLIIRNDGKRILRLEDIAAVKVTEQTQYIRINANDKSAILVVVVKQPNSNLITLTENIEKRVADLNGSILPEGVHLKPFYIQADFVKGSIRSVTDSLWFGLILAILVAILFLRSLKSSAVILITIPVTLALTLMVLYVMHYNFNIMTLGAMVASVGLIIDDAIVVVEQIHRTHEEHPETPTRELVSKAVRFLFPAMIGSSISTIVIFFPFVLLSGVAGAYFEILTNTMIITLVCSFLVSWIALPVVYLVLSGKSNKVRQRDHALLQKQGRWISFFIRRPSISIAFILMLAMVMVLVRDKLETGFLPEMDEGSIILDYVSPPGTSLQETDRVLREVEKLFPEVPEIESYSRRTGTEMGFFITEPNTGDYLIQLKKDRDRSTDEVIDDIRTRIEATQPSLQIDFGQVIGDMLGDLMSSTQPIEIKIFGDNQLIIQNMARQVAGIVEGTGGTADVFDGITIAGPSVSIVPDNRKLAQFGITPEDFQFQLQTQLEGNVIGSIYEKEQQTGIRMLYPDAASTSLDELRMSNLSLPDGKPVPLTRLADIRVDPGVAQISRENLQSMIAVIARLDQRDLGSVMKEIKEKIDSQVNLPQGYHISFGGAYQEQQTSFSELLLILILAALLVFIVMLFLFKDILVAFLILFISVMGISGSLLALWLTNTALNVGSYTGMIMIIGIIGENAVFTFLQFSHNMAVGTVNDSIVYAISTRLRPKLMTALGAIAALLPIALGIGTGAQLHQPLAIAVIGGFIIALPLLLIVYPSLLGIIFRHHHLKKADENL